jgi:MFS family permease
MTPINEVTKTSMKANLKYLPWLMWLLSASFYFYEFFLQVSPGVMVPDLMKEFNVTAARLGTLVAIYFYVYAFMQIPVGLLLDRYGPWRLLSAASATGAVGCYFFSAVHNLWAAELARALMGLGSAFSLVGGLKVLSRWFPAHRFATVANLLITVGLIGAIFGEGPLSTLVTSYGWRECMLFLSIAGGVLSLIIFLFLRDAPQTSHQPVSQTASGPFWAGLTTVLKNPQSWLVSFFAGFMYAPTPILGALWGETFIEVAYHLTRTEAAETVSVMFIGWAIGGACIGAISDYIRRRKPPMWIGAIGALTTLTTIFYLPNIPLALLPGLFFLFGMFSSFFTPAFALIREINPSDHSATSLGFINMVNMLGPAFIPPFIGIILDYYWNGATTHGVPMYSINDFHMGFIVLPIILVIPILLLPFIKETHCKPYDA